MIIQGLWMVWQAAKEFSSVKSISFSSIRKSLPVIRLRPASSRLQICCAAKSETLEKVLKIVKKQLALPEGTAITAESKFSELGADSLDTVSCLPLTLQIQKVEIVMGLEEAFGISVEEESAQKIVTVKDAANLIEELVKSQSC
ncbi:hypothetical protein GW17_00019452 [Ensete ventricosum]|uniref:Uncharacterized protein n=1 Tax=Ensete ventricosum TaxID=4639 RepID=A0A427A0S0_ENSVE|nr:hypothetical protein B296_00029025 [Ensete ventricosum]RWW16664.1 hypothetical protein GW17_00019452 [Ensete ventricosum]RZS07784.1 hypothetical protein BHM03_00038678 [Ensete ventricosum]